VKVFSNPTYCQGAVTSLANIFLWTCTKSLFASLGTIFVSRFSIPSGDTCNSAVLSASCTCACNLFGVFSPVLTVTKRSLFFLCKEWWHLIPRAKKGNLGIRLDSPLSVDRVNRAFSSLRPYCISEPETKTPSTIHSSSSTSPRCLRTCSNLLLSVSSIRRAISGWKINLDASKPKNNTELNVSEEHIIVCVPTVGRFVLMEMRFSFEITTAF